MSRERPLPRSRGRLESPIVHDSIEALGSLTDLVLWPFRPTPPPDSLTGRVTHCCPTGFADFAGILKMPAIPYYEIGRWVSLEFKRERGGHLSEVQAMHRDLVRKMGGFAVSDLRSPEEALAAIERARRGEDR